MTDYLQIVTTTPDEETAERIARLLVERRLAACVHLSGPIESTYWWQGKVESSAEWRLIVKSRADLFPALEAALREVHPYAVPELIATRIEAASAAYLSWMEAELAPREFAPPSARDGAAGMMASPSAPFHVSIHARPAGTARGAIMKLAGLELDTLAMPLETIGVPFAVSFETASDALARLERLFIEPDGSFVWASPADESTAPPRWQLDGVLYDRGGQLLYVDLKGSCPPSRFDQLLAALGWPATPLAFQLVREAVFLGEAEFRRLAWNSKTNHG
jgi:periplasmic divalent cation tolerance protein